MPDKPKHMWDQVTDSISEWVVSEGDWYANAIIGASQTPFSQPVSEDEKRKYYESQMYNKDGSPNEGGRQQVLQRIGIQGYVPLLQELEKGRRNTLPDSPPIPAVEPSIDPQLAQDPSLAAALPQSASEGAY